MFVRSGNRPARRLPAAQKTCLGGQHYLPPMGFSISLVSIPRSDTPRRNEISRLANAQKEPTTARLVQLPALMPWRRNRLVLKPNRYGGQRRSLSPEAFFLRLLLAKAREGECDDRRYEHRHADDAEGIAHNARCVKAESPLRETGMPSRRTARSS